MPAIMREKGPNMDKESNLIWMDLEMTGLDPEKDRIIEIATIITDKDLQILAQGPNLVINQSPELMNSMDEWCTRTHGESGLTQRVLDSSISEAQAEAETLAFVEQYTVKGTPPLCGNSIWQDRRFLAKYMCKLESHCTYRNVDVSSVKELARRWRPELLDGFSKKGAHLALDDIKESIEELKYYRDHFFIAPLDLQSGL